MTGAIALTSPPGLRRQAASPDGPTIRSTGSRLATTTNSFDTRKSPLKIEYKELLP
jgi:hypothetical protein